MGDVMVLAVGHSALSVPGLEDGPDGQPELLVGVLGEVPACLLLDDGFEPLNDVLPVLRRELRVGLDALLLFALLQHLFELIAVNPQDDLAEHLDEAAISIIDEARISGEIDHALGGFIVKAHIQDGVHHAGHGYLGSGAHRDQQGPLAIAEFLACPLLDHLEGVEGLLPHPFGKFLACLVIFDAGLGGDGKSRRHGQADVGHLG